MTRTDFVHMQERLGGRARVKARPDLTGWFFCIKCTCPQLLASCRPMWTQSSSSPRNASSLFSFVTIQSSMLLSLGGAGHHGSHSVLPQGDFVPRNAGTGGDMPD